MEKIIQIKRQNGGCGRKTAVLLDPRDLCESSQAWCKSTKSAPFILKDLNFVSVLCPSRRGSALSSQTFVLAHKH